jgi:hypothetical protein
MPLNSVQLAELMERAKHKAPPVHRQRRRRAAGGAKQSSDASERTSSLRRMERRSTCRKTLHSPLDPGSPTVSKMINY